MRTKYAELCNREPGKNGRPPLIPKDARLAIIKKIKSRLPPGQASIPQQITLEVCDYQKCLHYCLLF